jgi:MarR family transcriptional regulator, organic hydroperoxide resistance regulator
MSKAPNPSRSTNEAAEDIEALFKKVTRSFRELFFEASRQHGITVPQLWVIFQLHKKPNQNLMELSQTLELSKSTVSGIVSRLVTQGIVTRIIPDDNRRIVQLSLSPQYTKINELLKFRAQFFGQIVEKATAEEISCIIEGLETLFHLISADHGNDNPADNDLRP